MQQLEHTKKTDETLVKRLKIFENHCKHMQHLDETLATYK
jgi:hypothetical protein